MEKDKINGVIISYRSLPVFIYSNWEAQLHTVCRIWVIFSGSGSGNSNFSGSGSLDQTNSVSRSAILTTVYKKNRARWGSDLVLGSVADPYHFDTDPDPDPDPGSKFQ